MRSWREIRGRAARHYLFVKGPPRLQAPERSINSAALLIGIALIFPRHHDECGGGGGRPGRAAAALECVAHHRSKQLH